MSATLNGKPQRKQLADQIDRLDTILDGLADALNQSVADAAREGARSAVKEILVEVLSDPEIAMMIRAGLSPNAEPVPATPPTPQPSTPTTPGIWARIGHALQRAAQSIRAKFQSVATKSVTAVKSATKTLTAPFVAAKHCAANAIERVKSVPAAIRETVQDIRESVGSVRQTVLIGIGVGVAVAAVSMLSHTVAASIATTASAVAASVAHVGWKLHSLLRSVRVW